MTAAAYTDAAAVAAALRLSPDTTLAAPVAAGATSISIASNQVASVPGLFPGMYLALDQYNGSVREVVQITGAVTGSGPYTVPITPTVNAHSQGAPVKEVSALQDVVLAGSRLWDDVTFNYPGAFSQQSWTETLEGKALPDGRILVEVTGRNVTAVSSFTWQINPSDVAITIQPSQCTFKDYQVFAWPGGSVLTTVQGYPAGVTPYPHYKHLIVTISYIAGYNPLPPDIVRASTVLAARLFKEGDSGFSDTLANQEMGLLLYKKGIPSDIALMAKRWRRWT